MRHSLTTITVLKRSDSIREAQDRFLIMFEDYIRRRDIEIENDKRRQNLQMKLMTRRQTNQDHDVYD